MPQVKFIEHDGTEHVIDASNGDSIMITAINNLVPGIDADCGGECSCATCHVIVDDAWISNVGEPSDNEDSMLDLNPDRQPNSRLSCQIEMTDDLDDIVVNLPEFQY
ncbi:MAG TPA: 2Fe-2S ferredoxin [Gammaproteobacteria bacterium]|nr:2Fe-2S ferredoxin [Gammaproteobacteria bacterium]|tara:strand:- start:1171 stop:1491 length:321 start_codon:yes stop_codon:yes gene_type:complete